MKQGHLSDLHLLPGEGSLTIIIVIELFVLDFCSISILILLFPL